ncbi:MAG: TolC family protein [Proteobacteria bacterium]|nr:TolC family protein [Pseudomonadota bacterium]
MFSKKSVLLAYVAFALAGSFAAHAEEETLFPLDQPFRAEALVKAALERNPGLEEVRAAVEAVEAEIEPAGSLDDPMLSLNVAPNTFGSALGAREQVQLSQAFPWWGTLDAREDVARANALAVEQDVESLKLQLIEAAQSAFADWHYIHRALDVNARTQALLTDLREVAKARYAAGRAIQQDVLQADVERTLLRQQALELKKERTTIKARINALLNRSPGTPLPPPETLTLDVELPPLAALEAFARERHPMVEQLEFRQRAASANVTVAEKESYPEFRVMAGYNELMDPSEKRAIVGVSLSVPLNRSKYREQIRGARAQLRRTGYALEDLQSTLASDIAAAYAGVEEARQSFQLYRDELLPLANNTLAVARSDYGAGKGNFLNVITAERYLLETELRLVRTEAVVFQRLAELGRLAGTSFPFELPLSSSEFETEVINHD